MAKRKDKKRRGAAQSPTPRGRAARAAPGPGAPAKPKDTGWLPRPHAEKKRVFYIVSNYTGTGWYRCHVPGRGLTELGHQVVLNHEISAQELEFMDVLIFQMSASEDAKTYIQRANEIGKTTVFEIDDDYWNITPDNPVYEQWTKGDGLRLLRECLQLSQVVTTTTPYLQRILGRHHPNVQILPNMLPSEHWNVSRPPHPDKVIIGWAGGVSHYRDLEVIAGTIEQIVDEFPQVEFWLIGMAEYPFRPHERIKAHQSVKVEELGHFLANFDIGLAPLINNHFTRCKSDLKYLEYSAAGAAVIASPIEPYIHTIVDGKNGLLATTTKDWMRSLRRLVTDTEYRLALADAGKKLADSRSIYKNAHLWEKAYGIR